MGATTEGRAALWAARDGAMVDALVVAVVAGGTEAMARAAVVAADPASACTASGADPEGVGDGTSAAAGVADSSCCSKAVAC